MKWRLTAALLLSLPAGAMAQEDLTAASVSAATVAARPAFELQIDAPEAIRDLLNAYLDIKRYREVNDLSDNELRRLMQVAQEDSRALMGTAGYFAPDIQAELDIRPTDRLRTVKLTIVPGEAALVSDVKVTFTGAIAEDATTQPQRETIQNDWSLRTGMRFTQEQWDAAKLQALRQLIRERFPTGQLGATLADIDAQTSQARLSVTLDSGPGYRLGELQIKGLQQFDTALVTRLARIPVGATYNQQDLIAAQQRLATSGYFDSAYVSLDTSGDPDNAPVVVQLREGKLKKIVLGVGISTDSGPRLSVEHTNNKVPLLGWRALSKISIDKETQLISTELTAPSDMDNWRWITSGQIQSQNTGGVDVTSQRVRGGRRQDSERIDRSYYLEYDRADTASSTNALPIVAQSLSANYAFTLRSFDSMPFPSSGWGFGIEVGGGTTLGSQRDPYSRVLTRGRYYVSLADRDDNAATQLRSGRMVLRAEAGAVAAKEGISLPSTQLFLTGGDTTVRGYSYRELGVVQPSGVVAPGRYVVNGGVEWQSPLISNGQVTAWEGALFVDAGAVADTPANLNLKVGVGAGVRWKSPIGPLQIDLAYGLDTQKIRLHMNVGFNF